MSNIIAKAGKIAIIAKNMEPGKVIFDKILSIYDVEHIVIGHTPQENGIKKCKS